MGSVFANFMSASALNEFIHQLKCVVMRDYFCWFQLPVSFAYSGPSPLISLFNNAFLPAELLVTGCFFVFVTPLSANPRDCCA